MQTMSHDKTLFSKVLSCPITKVRLTSSTAELRGIVQSVIRSRDFDVNFIYCRGLNTLTQWELGYSPCSCGAVKVKVSQIRLCAWPSLNWAKGISGRKPYLSFLFASASYLTGIIFPDEWSEAGSLSELQGVSHQGCTGLSIHNHQQKTQCCPRWPNCLHISVAFTDRIGEGNMY